MIADSHTKHSTIYEMLIRTKQKAESLNLDETDLVCDHAVYSKALEVVLAEGNESLKEVINLKMGGFPMMCVFMAVIGKIYGDAGLRDLLIGSDISTEGRVEQVLRGKHYNNAMFAHLYVYESLYRLKINAFENWLIMKVKYQIFRDFAESNDVSALIREHNKENMVSVLEAHRELWNLMREYDQFLRNESGPMNKFWQQYLDMLEILFDFRKSVRGRNWNLHIAASERMLEWFFAYDRTNYARHFTFYWVSQLNLSQSHPNMLKEFQKDNFSVRRVPGKFNRLPADQVIEKTVNRNQKGPGGIIGFSTKEGTVQRWILTSHFAARLISQMEDSLQLTKSEKAPKDLTPKRVSYVESKIESCTQILQSWAPIFEDEKNLYSLSSGYHAHEDIYEERFNEC